MNLDPLIIYHSPCSDGFAAAWVAHIKYPHAEFVKGIYGELPPDCTDRDVFLLDFSYKRDVLSSIVAAAKRVTVLDHHKTAEADLEGLLGPNCGQLRGKFDMTKSGARLAWEWFFPNEPVPWLVQIVEDRDLWRFALPHSQELNAVLFSHEQDFLIWSNLDVALRHADHRARMVAEGSALLRKQNKDVRELVELLCHRLEFWKLEPANPSNMNYYGGISAAVPQTVLCANLPYNYASEAGNLMAKGEPFAATYYQDAKGDFVFSLRSDENGVDVSEIAMRYGGGGHKHAAGFRIQSLEEL